MDSSLVIIQKNQVLTSSRKVAEIFERQHKNVLQSIEEILVARKVSRQTFSQNYLRKSWQTVPRVFDEL